MELDKDGSGMLDLEEINNAPLEVMEKLQQMANIQELHDLFKVMDYDGNGKISIREFCDGILQSQGDMNMKTLRLMIQCSDILRTSRQTAELLRGPEGGDGRGP